MALQCSGAPPPSLHKLISSPFVPAGSMCWVNGRRAWHFQVRYTFFVPVIWEYGPVSPLIRLVDLWGAGDGWGCSAGGKSACISEIICVVKHTGVRLPGKWGLCRSWLNRMYGELWHHPCVEVIVAGGSVCVDLREIVSPWWLREAWCQASCCLLFLFSIGSLCSFLPWVAGTH